MAGEDGFASLAGYDGLEGFKKKGQLVEGQLVEWLRVMVEGQVLQYNTT